MIIILTGAGISAESGVKTYRSDTGLWEQHSIEDIATPEGFERDPGKVRAFYDARLDAVRAAEPNAAHLALSRLERESQVPVLVVTQNVDDLHERAGSRRVLHMHGRLGAPVCAGCGAGLPGERLEGQPPCPACGGQARPDITFFGEQPKHLEEIAEALSQVTIYISIGTSGEVFPAARFVRRARKRKARRIEVNIRRTRITNDHRELRHGPASIEVPTLVREILAEQLELDRQEGAGPDGQN
ncbi:NAD-dependent deacylase [Halovulum marinum]|nr:NAD-dependent deacylase [Halovulum marinum]